MRTTRAWIAALLLPLSGAPILHACGRSGEEATVNGQASAAGESDIAVVPADVPDACTFIPRSELEPLIGYELREGEPKAMPPGSSQCDFETPPTLYVTRKFDNPALPEAAGFSSVAVTTNASTPENFYEFRQTLGAAAEDVAGIADGAYFYGPAMIYVRRGDRGFSIRLYVNAPETDAGRARLRGVMLSLARAGVSKL